MKTVFSVLVFSSPLLLCRGVLGETRDSAVNLHSQEDGVVPHFESTASSNSPDLYQDLENIAATEENARVKGDGTREEVFGTSANSLTADGMLQTSVNSTEHVSTGTYLSPFYHWVTVDECANRCRGDVRCSGYLYYVKSNHWFQNNECRLVNTDFTGRQVSTPYYWNGVPRWACAKSRASADFPYEGCLKSPPFEKEIAKDDSSPEAGQSVWKCAEFCAKENAQRFAVSGTACTCGNSTMTTSGHVVATRAEQDKHYCIDLCSDDDKIQCGGWQGRYHSSYRLMTPHPEFEYRGCFEHDTTNPELNGNESTTAGEYPAECSHFCDGFEFFGLSEGKCRCGNSHTKSIAKTDRECRTECKKEQAVACGGSGTNSVYVVKNPQHSKDYRFIGCFQDKSGGPESIKSPRSDPVDTTWPPPHHASPSQCAEFCHGYSYFGLKAGEQCFCFEHYGFWPTKETEVSKCREECANEPGTICGGPQALSIYLTDNSGPTPVISKEMRNIRCTSAAFHGWWILQPTTKPFEFGSPVLCNRRCASQGFGFFLLRDYGTCLCTTRDPGGSHNEEFCHLPCVKDPTVSCGGKTYGLTYEVGRYRDPEFNYAGCMRTYHAGTEAHWTRRIGGHATPEACHKYCNTFNKDGEVMYKYFGLNHNWCACGNSFVEVPRMRVEDKSCWYRAGGARGEFKGGDTSYQQSVYYNDDLSGPPGECLCGDDEEFTKTHRQAVLDADDNEIPFQTSCIVRCEDEPMVACGGTTAAFSVYETTRPDADRVHVGCFEDPDGNDLGGSLVSTKVEDVSTSGCQEFCSSKGTLYFGLREGEECHCGDTYGSKGQAPSWKCHRTCPDSNFVSCGGEKTTDVYAVTATRPVPSDSYLYLGCLDAKALRALADQGEIDDSGTKGAPGPCASFCDEKGSAYFALGKEGSCFCVNSLGDAKGQKEGESDMCHLPCPKADGVACGGALGVSVYATQEPVVLRMTVETSEALGAGSTGPIEARFCEGYLDRTCIDATVNMTELAEGKTQTFETKVHANTLSTTAARFFKLKTVRISSQTHDGWLVVKAKAEMVQGGKSFAQMNLNSLNAWFARGASEGLSASEIDLEDTHGDAEKYLKTKGKNAEVWGPPAPAQSVVCMRKEKAILKEVPIAVLQVQGRAGKAAEADKVSAVGGGSSSSAPLKVSLCDNENSCDPDTIDVYGLSERDGRPLTVSCPLYLTAPPSSTQQTPKDVAAELLGVIAAVQLEASATDMRPVFVKHVALQTLPGSADPYEMVAADFESLWDGETFIAEADGWISPMGGDDTVGGKDAFEFQDGGATTGSALAAAGGGSFLAKKTRIVKTELMSVTVTTRGDTPACGSSGPVEVALCASGSMCLEGGVVLTDLQAGETQTFLGVAPPHADSFQLNALLLTMKGEGDGWFGRSLKAKVGKLSLELEMDGWLDNPVMTLSPSEGGSEEGVKQEEHYIGDPNFVLVSTRLSRNGATSAAVLAPPVPIDGQPNCDGPLFIRVCGKEGGADVCSKEKLTILDPVGKADKDGLAHGSATFHALKDDFKLEHVQVTNGGKGPCVFDWLRVHLEGEDLSHFGPASPDLKLEPGKTVDLKPRKAVVLKTTTVGRSAISEEAGSDGTFLFSFCGAVVNPTGLTLQEQKQQASQSSVNCLPAQEFGFVRAWGLRKGETQEFRGTISGEKAQIDLDTWHLRALHVEAVGSFLSLGKGPQSASATATAAASTTPQPAPPSTTGATSLLETGASLIRSGAESNLVEKEVRELQELAGRQNHEDELASPTGVPPTSSSTSSATVTVKADVDAWRLLSFTLTVADSDHGTFPVHGSLAKKPDEVTGPEAEDPGNFLEVGKTINAGDVSVGIRAITRDAEGAGSAGPVFVHLCPKPGQRSQCVGKESAIRLYNLKAGQSQDFFGVISGAAALGILAAGKGIDPTTLISDPDFFALPAAEQLSSENLHDGLAGAVLQSDGGDPWFAAALRVNMQTEALVNNRGELVVPKDSEGLVIWANGWVAPPVQAPTLTAQSLAEGVPADFVQDDIYLEVKGIKVTLEVKTIDHAAAGSAGPFELTVCSASDCLPPIKVANLLAANIQSFESAFTTNDMEFVPEKLNILAPPESGLDAWGCEWVAVRFELGPRIHFGVSAWLAGDSRSPDFSTIQQTPGSSSASVPTARGRKSFHMYTALSGPRIGLSVTTHGLAAAGSKGPVKVSLCEGEGLCLSESFTLDESHLQSGKQSKRLEINFPELLDNPDFRLNALRLVSETGDAWYPESFLLEGLSGSFAGRSFRFSGLGWLEEGVDGSAKGAKERYPAEPVVLWTGGDVLLDVCKTAQCSEDCREMPHFDKDGKFEFNGAECLCSEKGQSLMADGKSCGFTFIPKEAYSRVPQCRNIDIADRKECGNLKYEENALWLGEWEQQQAECEALGCCFEARPEYLGCFVPDLNSGPKLSLTVSTSDETAEAGCAGDVDIFVCESPEHCLSKPFVVGKDDMVKGKTSAPKAVNFPELADNGDFQVNGLRLVAHTADGWFPQEIKVSGGAGGPFAGREWAFEGIGWLEYKHTGKTHPPAPKPKWIGDDVYLDACTVKGCHDSCHLHPTFDKNGKHTGSKAECRCSMFGFELQKDGVSCGQIVLPATAFQVNPQCQLPVKERKLCGALSYDSDALMTGDWDTQRLQCEQLNCCFEAHLGYLGCYQPYEKITKSNFTVTSDSGGIAITLKPTTLLVEEKLAQDMKEGNQAQHFRSHSEVIRHEELSKFMQKEQEGGGRQPRSLTLEDRLLALYGLSGEDLAAKMHEHHLDLLEKSLGIRKNGPPTRPFRPNATRSTATLLEQGLVDKPEGSKWYEHEGFHENRGDTDAPPSIDFLGIGYDIMKGNVWGENEGTLIDPGFRAPVIGLTWGIDTEDGKWQRPTEARLMPTYSCYRNEDVEEISSAETFMASEAKAVSNSAGAYAGWTWSPGDFSSNLGISAEGGYSQSSSSETEKLQESSQTEYQMVAYCILYKANLSPYIPWKPTSEVVKALVALPENYIDCKQCKRYVELASGLLSPAKKAPKQPYAATKEPSCSFDITTVTSRNAKCECYDPSHPTDPMSSTFYRLEGDAFNWYKLKITGSLTLEKVKQNIEQGLDAWVEKIPRLEGMKTCNEVCGATESCSEDFQKYQAFFENFGTHVITEVQVGARMRHVATMSDSAMEELQSQTSDWERDVSFAIDYELGKEIDDNHEKECKAAYCVVEKGVKTFALLQTGETKERVGNALIRSKGKEEEKDGSESGLSNGGRDAEVKPHHHRDRRVKKIWDAAKRVKGGRLIERQRPPARSETDSDETLSASEIEALRALSGGDEYYHRNPDVESDSAASRHAGEQGETCTQWRRSEAFNLAEGEKDLGQVSSAMATFAQTERMKSKGDDWGIRVGAHFEHNENQQTSKARGMSASRAVSNAQTFILGGLPPSDETAWPEWAETVHDLPMPVRYSTLDLLGVFDAGFRRQAETVVAAQAAGASPENAKRMEEETREGFEKLRNNFGNALKDYLHARGLKPGTNCKYDSVGNILEWGNGGKECQVKCFAEVFAEPDYIGNHKKFKPGIIGVAPDDPLNFVPDNESLVNILNKAIDLGKMEDYSEDEDARTAVESMEANSAPKSLKVSSGCHLVKMAGLDDRGLNLEREFYADTANTHIAKVMAVEVVKSVSPMPEGTFRLRYRKAPKEVPVCVGIANGFMQLIGCDDVTSRLRFYRRMLEQQGDDANCLSADELTDAKAMCKEKAEEEQFSSEVDKMVDAHVANMRDAINKGLFTEEHLRRQIRPQIEKQLGKKAQDEEKIDNGEAPNLDCQPAYKRDEVVLLKTDRCRLRAQLADLIMGVSAAFRVEEGKAWKTDERKVHIAKRVMDDLRSSASESLGDVLNSAETFFAEALNSRPSKQVQQNAYKSVKDLARPAESVVEWDGLHVQWKRKFKVQSESLGEVERSELYCLQPASPSCKAGTPLVFMPCAGDIEQEWFLEEYVGQGCKVSKFGGPAKVVPMDWTGWINEFDETLDFTSDSQCSMSMSTLLQSGSASAHAENTTAADLVQGELQQQTNQGEAERQKGFEPNGIIGWDWTFDDDKNDNRYKFRCGTLKSGPEIDEDNIEELKKTEFVNDQDENDGKTWTRKCRGNSFICRVQAEHNSDDEDRSFVFSCCPFKPGTAALGEEATSAPEGKDDRDMTNGRELQVPRGHILTGVYSLRKDQGRWFKLYSRELLSASDAA
uniref:WSC domain-containing protein n=1 Tax=Chromera velia CCMP2878 TaxID=1169474 RepID=A0A0G4I7S8_9ALVE|eukprot:Cvel_1944.t1-p1 / transcript=Cvel_1944.t1 / gene=Cvel_1944 / organism=Chromera_velia_CCMP2878 / gene_product=Putative fungistatic metabolite, putative / transcript_product=Putative fungistatic metabolite, putative / location=Cvel_scaffold73:88562-121751(-) / protein_length=4224 / sequence_SO=supercontig / SO=protein_coding / is_pseudo=false